MDFITRAVAPATIKTGCLILGIYEKAKLSEAAASVDRASGGALSRALKLGDNAGKAGQTLLLYALPKVAAERVLLVGLGEKANVGKKTMQLAALSATNVLNTCGANDAVFYLLDEGVDYAAQLTVLAIAQSTYRFNELKTVTQTPNSPLNKVTLASENAATVKAATRELPIARALVSGVEFTKRLGNLPGNIATPSYLAKQAETLKKFGIKVKVLERKDCEKLGMGSFLAVAQGSAEAPKFIVLEYLAGAKTSKPTVLVGKGITFDTGGISIKPVGDMDHMKWDMSGAGSVLGVMRALGEIGAKVNVIGLIPSCENMPGGRSIKPGDIVKSMSGQTIEILNTDAEGRLILCDALTYAERFNPKTVIDIATLTGACVVALGAVVSGLFSNSDKLANDLLEAGQRTYDRTWRMPLWEDYQDGLQSNFADMANIGSREGGAITAACFLWRYAKKYDWAHLDVAGIAYNGGKAKGASGRPVPMLLDYILHNA